MDESRENLPPTECPSPHRDGPPRGLEANPLTEVFHFSTPAQYNCNGGAKLKSQTLSCLLPDLTPVSKYLLPRQRFLRSANTTPSPEFVPIQDEILPHSSFDVSSIECVADLTATSSPLSSQEGAAAEAFGSCSDLKSSSLSSSAHTLQNTMEISAALTNQSATDPINDTFDLRPPGPSKCNVTADGDSTGQMAALNNTFDAEHGAVTEAVPAEVGVSEAEPCNNTFETKSVSALCSTNAIVDPHNTFDMDSSTNLSSNQATAAPIRVILQNTFDTDRSASLTNHQTTAAPIRVDLHGTFDMDGSASLLNHQTTARPIRVNLHNTFDMELSTNLNNHQTTTNPMRINPQNTFDFSGSTRPMRDNPHNTFDMDSPTRLTSPENDTSDVHPPGPSKCKNTTVDAELDAKMVDLHMTFDGEQVLVTASEDEPGVVAASKDEPGVVAVSADEPGVVAEPVVRAVAEPEDVEVSADEQGVVAVSEEELGVVAVSEDGDVAESVVRAVCEAQLEDVAVTRQDDTQSSTLNVSVLFDSPVVCLSGACNLLNDSKDTIEFQEDLKVTSTPMPRSHAPEKVWDNVDVVPRKLYQSHSQFVPPTNPAESHSVPATSTESNSQFVPPTNIVSDRKTFMNLNDPRVKHLQPPSSSMIPGVSAKKHSGLRMMRRAQANGLGSPAALPKEATGIRRSVLTEAKGIPKVTRSTDKVGPAVGTVLRDGHLRRLQTGSLPIASQRALPTLRPPMTRSKAGLAAASGELTVHANAAPAVPLLKTGQPPNRRDLRRDTSSGEAALLAKKMMDVPVPSTSSEGPSQTVKTGQTPSLKRPGSRLALPGAKQKKTDVPVPSKASSDPSQPARAARGLKPPTGNQRTLKGCPNCSGVRQELGEARQELEGVRQELEEARQEIGRLQELLQN